MFKIDLHTHSIASPDGGISASEYENVITKGKLDYIAITDHNRIDFAQKMAEKLGDRIIVGEEIMTTSGEIIGLYLKEKIPAGLSTNETIKKIKEQGGLVYVPHPLENTRKGLQINVLEEIVDYIDIMEIGNGRALLQSKYSQVLVWTNLNNLIGVASSDSHGKYGFGRTYTSIHDAPSRNNILSELAKGTPYLQRPTLRALLYPKYNRIMRRYS